MKYLLKISLIFGFFLWTLSINSQTFELSSSNKKATKYYSEAETAFKSFEYLTTIKKLHKATQKDPEFIEAWLLLGDTYSEINQNTDAINAFKRAVQIDSSFFPRASFFIGNLAFKEGDYSVAVSYYKQYLLFKDEKEITRFLAKKRLKKAKFADSLISHPLDITVNNSGFPINTSSDEYINFVNESFYELVLTRKVKVGNNNQDQMLFAEHFFKSLADTNGWRVPQPMVFDWLKGLNIGGMNLSVDGRKMYLTGCNWPTGLGSCDVYMSEKKGTTWEQAVNLGSKLNSQWWDSQPIVSSDGKRLFYSSKRTGGKGGSDIWMSVQLESGKWSPPVNLGDSINTGGNEMAPFLHADGKTLYFSSDGHDGLGGSDLFISRKDETGQWTKAKNLGSPINTKYNEINMFVSLNGQMAYLSSDRPGGEGGFDIYEFETIKVLRPSLVYFVKGIVKDNETGKPLKSEVTLTDLSRSLVVDKSISDEQTGEFLMVLQHNVEYAFNISKTNYLFYSEHFNFKDTANKNSIEKVFYLEPVKAGKNFVLENVFFDFNQFDLKPKSFNELNKLLKLLEENHNISILIAGHTDNVGSQEYNLELSEERARVVFQYLNAKGISADRLKFKGYGSNMPIADNASENGRARNRRTEITIL